MPDPITYHTFGGALSPERQSSIADLYEQIFGSSAGRVKKKLSERSDFVTVVAEDPVRVVGFKIGYPDKEHRFYSWLGGVHSEYRRRGIGEEMMHRQHAYCRQAGFLTIRTKTTNHWRAMLLLNICQGFNITGTYVGEQGNVKIILEKQL